MTRTDLLARADGLRRSRVPFVLATVVRVVRPASAKPGDSALILMDGTIDGFVGGDCAESTVRLHALRQLAAGRSALLRITPGGPGQPQDVGEGLVTAANPCLSGGTLEIFLEVMKPPMLVHVFGDTPVARALAGLGGAMGWEMRASTRPEDPIAPDTWAVVVASHGGGEEGRVLAAALQAGTPYIGLVASRRRGSALVAGLGVTPAQARRLHTPAGLDIRASGPGEIALSILAEIVASRDAPVSAAAAPGPPAAAPGPAAAAPGQPVAAPVPGLAVPGPGGPSWPGPGAPGSVTVADAADPVCGMTVAVSAASLRLEYAGTTWYFCGTGCRDAFVADPARYAAAAGGARA